MKRRFTLEEHWTVGTLLYNSQSALQGLFITVSRAYPLKSRQVRELEKALKALGGVYAAAGGVHGAAGEEVNWEGN